MDVIAIKKVNVSLAQHFRVYSILQHQVVKFEVVVYEASGVDLLQNVDDLDAEGEDGVRCEVAFSLAK